MYLFYIRNKKVTGGLPGTGTTGLTGTTAHLTPIPTIGLALNWFV